MVALSDIITRSIDRARASGENRYEEHVVLSGRLQQTVVVLLEGAQLPPHHADDVSASLYIMHGAIRIVAEDPFVLQSGHLHEMPPQRREVIALQDTVMLLTAVPEGTAEDEDIHVLPRA